MNTPAVRKNVQSSSKNRPFAVFDIDGTLVRWQLFHAIAIAVMDRLNISADVRKPITDAHKAWRERGGAESFRAYESTLVHFFDSEVLKDLPVDLFTEAAEQIFEEHKDLVYRHTRDLIHDLKSRGYLLFAISGSPTEAVQLIADYYGFDDFLASSFERKGKVFTGEKHIYSHHKDKLLEKLVKKHNATYSGSIAVGDSEGDIEMLEAVEHPIAFNPSSLLLRHAEQRGWPIVIERKNVIYELEYKHGQYVLAQTSCTKTTLSQSVME